MANPQAERGHIDIANEIAEALMRINLSAYQSRIVWAVFRKTYGWHKKKDYISVSQFEKMTKIKQGHVSRTVRELEMRRILIVEYTQRGMIITFNKNYSEWKQIDRMQRPYRHTQRGMIPNGVYGHTQRGMKSIPNGVSTKEKKETLQKKIYSRTSDEVRLSGLLFSLIKQRDSKAKADLQRWALHIDRLIRLDKRKPADIEAVIRWCQEDDFWQSNILSTQKLRKQFTQLWIKMTKGGLHGERSFHEAYEQDIDGV